jgi:adenylate cyclase
MSFIGQLKRRNVFRAAAAYVAVAWVLMQVAEVAFPAFGLTEHALRLLIIALAIGFIPAATLSWVFELTPEGLKRERDLDRSGPLVARTNRLLDRGIIVLLGLGLSYFAVDKFLLDPARVEARVQEAVQQGRSEALEQQFGDKSIVVLPFRNLSSDPEQEFFADGMSEELINLLARIPQLRVISRTSAFAFKGKDVELAEIATKLKVSHVLEGSVLRAGDRMRITAQLIDVSTDSPLWSETYDRTLDDIFAVQDDIAARVVSQLKLKLLGQVLTRRRIKPQAYVLYMQARQLLDRWSNPERSYAMLQRVLELEPRYADGWMGLSRWFFHCGTENDRDFCRQFSREEAMRRSDEAREKALRIDPDNAIAISYAAWGRAFVDKDWAGAAPGFERALRLDPSNPEVLRTAANYALEIRKPDVAIRLGEFAVARDPLCTMCVRNLAFAYMEAGRLDDAELTMRSLVTGNIGGWYRIGVLRVLQGDGEGALDAFAHLSDPDDDWRLSGRAMALHSLGREQESQDELARLQARYPKAYQLIADVYAWRGDLDRAFALLEDAIADPRPRIYFPIDRTDPFLRPVLGTERGQALLRRFGLADDQLAAIPFAVDLPRAQSERSGLPN